MPDAPNPETKQFLDALNAFMENPPRDLPEGATDTIKELAYSLKGYGAQEQSPGQREAQEKSQGGSDTAVPYKDAAKGPDEPSPGQREYQEFASKAQELAQMAGSLPGPSQE